MYLRLFRLGVCLVLCVGGLLGLYRLQAETHQQRHQETTHLSPALPSQFQPQFQPRLDAKTEPLLADDLHSDFYQTILKNNLFAPLGTVLDPKFAIGANLTVIGTFVTTDPLRSRAVLKNETTGEHHVLGIGGVLGDFTVMKIQPKQVTLDHHGNPPVVLHLPEPVLLNAKRR